MSKKADAFQNVYEAIDLDSNGLYQIAFSKYLQSLQALSSYLVEQYHIKGFQKIIDNHKEVKQVLSLICDCADRVEKILNCKGSSGNSPSVIKKRLVICDDINNGKFQGLNTNKVLDDSVTKPSVSCSSLPETFTSSRFPALDNVQKENAVLFRKYQRRLANAKDQRTRANLQLELQRRLAENLVVAKTKHAKALKEQQRERRKMFELATRTIMQTEPCTSQIDQKKRDLYLQVLQHEVKQTRPLNFDLSSYQLKHSEIVEKVFERTMGNSDHPLTQYVIMVQIKLKRKLEPMLKDLSTSTVHIPDIKFFEDNGNPCITTLENRPFSYEVNESTVPHDQVSALNEYISSVATEIKATINDVLQIFYLAYKRDLPEDSDAVCYKLIESFFLRPLWPRIILFLRLLNLTSEMQVARVIMNNWTSTPDQFGISSGLSEQVTEVCSSVILQLRRIPLLTSLVDKLNILVQVAHKLCTETESGNLDKESDKKVGVDDFISILSYVLVKTGVVQLVSECHALELLVDEKYMLGEEGYALASFKTALNYLEMKKFVDGEGSASTSRGESTDSNEDVKSS